MPATPRPLFSDPKIAPHPSRANPIRFRITWTDPVLGRRQDYRRTMADAQVRKAEIIAEQAQGVTVRGHDRLGSWLDRWMETKGGIRESTRERYQRAVDTWRGEPIARMQLRELRADDVELAMRRMERAGRSPVTIGTALTVLRQALDAATRSDRMVRNVARVALAPKVERAPIVPPMGDDRMRLDAAIAADPWEALWLAGLVGGLRISEALGLRWRDVEPDAYRITVRAQLERGTRDYVKPKSERSGRRIPVYPILFDALERYRARTYPPGITPHPDSPVFMVEGRPLAQRTVTRWFDTLCVRAGIRHYRYHDLRHAAITDLALRGMASGRLMVWAGHHSITVTERYFHIQQSDLELPAPSQPVTQSVTHHTGTPTLTTAHNGTSDRAH